MYFFCTSGSTYFPRPASSKRAKVVSKCGMMSPTEANISRFSSVSTSFSTNLFSAAISAS